MKFYSYGVELHETEYAFSDAQFCVALSYSDGNQIAATKKNDSSESAEEKLRELLGEPLNARTLRGSGVKYKREFYWPVELLEGVDLSEFKLGWGDAQSPFDAFCSLDDAVAKNWAYPTLWMPSVDLRNRDGFDINLPRAEWK